MFYTYNVFSHSGTIHASIGLLVRCRCGLQIGRIVVDGVRANDSDLDGTKI